MQKKFSIFPWKIGKNRPKIINFLPIFQNFRLRRFLTIFGFAARLETTNIRHNEYTIRNITFITLLLYKFATVWFLFVFQRSTISTVDILCLAESMDVHFIPYSEVRIYITSTQCRDSITHTLLYEYTLSYITGEFIVRNPPQNVCFGQKS